MRTDLKNVSRETIIEEFSKYTDLTIKKLETDRILIIYRCVGISLCINDSNTFSIGEHSTVLCNDKFILTYLKNLGCLNITYN